MGLRERLVMMGFGTGGRDGMGRYSAGMGQDRDVTRRV